MYRFFDSTIRPLLDELPGLRTMIEVGAEKGLHTGQLLPYARSRGAHLHIIDPAPLFNVERFKTQFASCSTFHVAMSHDALPLIEGPDVVLLDGDHNWYTVIEELRILDRADSAWPVTFVHDIEWPYGRRDMYYAPARIPDEHRQPWAQSGIVRGQSELSPDGVNDRFMNALHEGGPCNGVLTGLEDFLAETERNLALFTASGNHGLGIVVDRRQLRKPRFTKVLRRVAR